MNVEIRQGYAKDVDALEKLYDELNDYLEATTNYPGWKKGVYPIRQDAEDGIAAKDLYVAVQGDEIAGAVILSHKQEPAYAKVMWQKDLEKSEVLAIYTLVVSPKYFNKGIGKAMLDFAHKKALTENVKALRLDVYEKNLPAIGLYKKCGFHYIGKVSLGLEAAGLDWFKLYEKLL